MSIADGRRILDLVTAVAALLARVAALEEMLADTPAPSRSFPPLSGLPAHL